jgi:hypothetical protein
MPKFSKFVRPQTPSRGVITDRDAGIIASVLRYRFSPTSELVRLVGGNEDVVLRRLRKLWEWGFINRFAFPGIRTHSEFIYYLDSPASLELLSERRGLEIHPQMREELQNNRDKDYASAATHGQHMQLGFLKHALMISRMHFLLEMACRKSARRIELASWSQGGELARRKVELPKVTSARKGNQYVWEEQDETERVPVEPDALFSLRFTDRRPEEQLAHFFFEADRGTMVASDMLKKLRGYYHLIKRQKRHAEMFGVHPVRSVLIETTSEQRGKRLMELVNHPIVCGPTKRAGLFWFTISPLFTAPLPDPTSRRPLARYLRQPEVIFDPIWALPDSTLHGLADAKNSSPATP